MPRLSTGKAEPNSKYAGVSVAEVVAKIRAEYASTPPLDGYAFEAAAQRTGRRRHGTYPEPAGGSAVGGPRLRKAAVVATTGAVLAGAGLALASPASASAGTGTSAPGTSNPSSAGTGPNCTPAGSAGRFSALPLCGQVGVNGQKTNSSTTAPGTAPVNINWKPTPQGLGYAIGSIIGISPEQQPTEHESGSQQFDNNQCTDGAAARFSAEPICGQNGTKNNGRVGLGNESGVDPKKEGISIAEGLAGAASALIPGGDEADPLVEGLPHGEPGGIVTPPKTVEDPNAITPAPHDLNPDGTTGPQPSTSSGGLKGGGGGRANPTKPGSSSGTGNPANVATDPYTGQTVHAGGSGAQPGSSGSSTTTAQIHPAPSESGGGGSATTRNPDGTVTTTTRNPDGTVTTTRTSGKQPPHPSAGYPIKPPMRPVPASSGDGWVKPAPPSYTPTGVPLSPQDINPDYDPAGTSAATARTNAKQRATTSRNKQHAADVTGARMSNPDRSVPQRGRSRSDQSSITFGPNKKPSGAASGSVAGGGLSGTHRSTGSTSTAATARSSAGTRPAES